MRLTLAFAVLLVTIVVALAAQSTSTGTGFVVSSDGYVLTNEHVIADASTITVTVENRTYAAEVITQSAETDLALLKIDGENLPTVPLGNSLYVEPLDEVVSLGYPASQLGEDLTVSTGRITSIRTNVDGREGQETFQHDAVIYSGSSGGPLFDEYGEVIGVNYARIEGSGLQFAIPINDALPLLRQIPGFDVRTMGQAIELLAPQEILAARRNAVAFIACEVVIDISVLTPNTIPGYVHQEASSVDASALQDWGFSVVSAAAIRASEHVEIGEYAGASVIAVLFGSEAEAIRAAKDAVFQLSDGMEITWQTDLGECWSPGEWEPNEGLIVDYRLRLAVGERISTYTISECWDIGYGRTHTVPSDCVPVSSSLAVFDDAGACHYAGFEGIASIRLGSALVQAATFLFVQRCHPLNSIGWSSFVIKDGSIVEKTWLVGPGFHDFPPDVTRTHTAIDTLVEEFEDIMRYAVVYLLEQIGSGE